MTVATTSLSLLLLGMALSIIPSWGVRFLIGGSALVALTFSMPHFIRNHFAPYQTRQEQYLIAKTLLDACRMEKQWRSVALSIQDPQLCARLTWPIRRCKFLPQSQESTAEVRITDHPSSELPVMTKEISPVFNLPNHPPIYLFSEHPSKVTQ